MDILDEISEELKKDKALDFLKKYGFHIIGVISGILLISILYLGWSYYQESGLEAESDAYIAALEKISKDPIKASSELSELSNSYGGQYGTLAKFIKASIYLQNKQIKEAVEVLEAIVADSSTDKYLRKLATVRLIQAKLDTGDAKKLLQEVAPLVTADNPWSYSARELKGLLLLKTGDKSSAYNTFHTLASDRQAPRSLANRAAEVAGYLDQNGMYSSSKEKK